MTEPSMNSLLAKVADGASLDESEAESAFDIIMSGDATPSQIGAFLMAPIWDGVARPWPKSPAPSASCAPRPLS